MDSPLDHLDIETFSPLGDAPVVFVDATAGAVRYRTANAIIIGVDRVGDLLSTLDAHDFDILLTTQPDAPRPWVSVAPDQLGDKLKSLAETVRRNPHAASVLRQVLRINETATFEQSLLVESFAYSTLLGGAEFRAWRGANPAGPGATSGDVRYERATHRDGDHVTLTLAQPDTRNAMTAAMRDSLFDFLTATLDDPTAPSVTLRADGACFSVGGALSEFGANPDLAQAHTIRVMRSVARLIHELGDRIEVVFHGACIGSGLEAAAAAAKRTATEGAFFQLPEVKMGLIPGAGGTVTVPRAIGRHRACAMMLGGARLSAATALDWGLVQSIKPRS